MSASRGCYKTPLLQSSVVRADLVTRSTSTSGRGRPRLAERVVVLARVVDTRRVSNDSACCRRTRIAARCRTVDLDVVVPCGGMLISSFGVSCRDRKVRPSE